MAPRETFPPRLVFDDDCGFCTWCAEFAAVRGQFDLVGFSDLSPDQLARLPDGYDDCAHLLTDDAVYSCGEAIEEALTRVDTPARLPAEAFRLLPARAGVRESLYRTLADNRDLLGKVARREPPARKSR
ncbi:DUF393 domain-containing protein [Natronobiforma cellulositropha]|uniref:DUF393 domain-containing protein n=1 Tax=Natronobiforma cellulositropha TaxID=1679076 RepID=UPI0021D5D0F6|nr:DUF393 domain-containing protein [Natronobiforma cellulositropha]